LGQADKVWSDKDNTRIIGGKGSKKEVDNRVLFIKRQIKETDSEFDREKLEERLAKLSGGVAVINVGAATEVEMNEKKERVKDAVGATKAAVEEGIVPGGGIALLKIKKAVEKLTSDNKDEQIGIDIVANALEQPVRYLVKNAGQDDGYIVNKLLESREVDYGYNVLTEEFGSMIKFGLLDPLKVTRSALVNSSSIAMMILTTEALVADIPEKEKAEHDHGGSMGGF